MKELLKIAARFMKKHPNFNEVEITDSFNNSVHLVRRTLSPTIYQAPYE